MLCQNLIETLYVLVLIYIIYNGLQPTIGCQSLSLYTLVRVMTHSLEGIFEYRPPVPKLDDLLACTRDPCLY